MKTESGFARFAVTGIVGVAIAAGVVHAQYWANDGDRGWRAMVTETGSNKPNETVTGHNTEVEGQLTATKQTFFDVVAKDSDLHLIGVTHYASQTEETRAKLSAQRALKGKGKPFDNLGEAVGFAHPASTVHALIEEGTPPTQYPEFWCWVDEKRRGHGKNDRGHPRRAECEIQACIENGTLNEDHCLVGWASGDEEFDASGCSMLTRTYNVADKQASFCEACAAAHDTFHPKTLLTVENVCSDLEDAYATLAVDIYNTPDWGCSPDESRFTEEGFTLVGDCGCAIDTTDTCGNFTEVLVK